MGPLARSFFVSLRVPRIQNLRRDPFERAHDESVNYNMWIQEKQFAIVPAADYAARAAATFKEFPPRGRPGELLARCRSEDDEPGVRPTELQGRVSREGSHLNTEEEPEDEDFPRDRGSRRNTAPAGLLKCVALGANNPDTPADDRFGPWGCQRCEDTGPLTRKHMEMATS